MWKVLLVVVILSGSDIMVLSNNGHDYFSSITGMESLLKTEEVLVQDLKEYIKSTKAHISSLESELIKITQEQETAAADTENYLTNPVNAYRLIKRLYSDWPTYEDRIRQDFAGTYFVERMTEHRQNLDFPSKDDVDGSAVALVRLQETYQLDVTQVAAGFLNGIKYGSAMTWQDCFILGQHLLALHDYNHTKVWLKESMSRLSQEQYAHDTMSLNFKEGVAENLFHLGDLEYALKLSLEVLDMDPERVKAENIKYMAETLLENGKTQHLNMKSRKTYYHDTQEFRTYEKLCRGEFGPTPEKLRPLRCRYVTNNKHYRLIAPFKVEEHSLDPMVLTIHDVIEERKINALKGLATPYMSRSKVRADVGTGSTAMNYRISKTAWLKYHTHPYMLDMLRDLHDLTGLDMTYCEELQVVNYGLGGHYEPHCDFFKKNTVVADGNGNRIATAIFYFSDVEQGGATAFPHLNITVKPQKGNVLFWYNLHRSLDLDYRTKHAGCPVLKGSKWIANVWIRERTQMFARPCDLQRDHEVSLPYELTI